MAEEHKKGLNAGLVGNDLENCCRKETACGQCQKTNCIINVIRSCYEVGLWGDVQPYEGSALQYLMYLKENFPDKSLQIAELYRN